MIINKTREERRQYILNSIQEMSYFDDEFKKIIL